MAKGGVPDYNATFSFIMKWFRDGKLGRWTFDNLAPPGVTGEELEWKVWQSVGDYIALMEAQQEAALRGEGLSITQEAKRLKEAKLEKQVARYRRMREERAPSMDFSKRREAAAKRRGR
jgi:hypothetical protein